MIDHRISVSCIFRTFGARNGAISHLQAAHRTSFPRRYAAISLFLLLSLAWLGCGGDPKPNSARANTTPSVPVSVSTAERRDMPYYLTGLGSVTAFYTVNLKSRVDGQLNAVNFTEGQFVNKGDLLAVIDPRPYQVVLDQSQATLFRDQALLRDARLNYERFKNLLQVSGAMSQ